MARNKYPEETEKLILDVAQQLFLEKGYDDTSIQDIINGLGGLSKGAVYHHFKSKEEIFNAVGDRYNKQIISCHQRILNDKNLNGFEKLKKMFDISLESGDRDIVYTVAPNFLDNPRLLASQIREIVDDIAPNYVLPVIEQGIKDGSIVTQYPKEVSEVMMILTNVWMNPLVLKCDEKEQENKVRFFGKFLSMMGVDILNDQMIESYIRYCRMNNNENKNNK